MTGEVEKMTAQDTAAPEEPTRRYTAYNNRAGNGETEKGGRACGPLLPGPGGSKKMVL